MNSLILLHNKYPSNKSKNNDNEDDLNDIFNDNEKNNNELFEINKENDSIKINNSFQIGNSPNNIFDLSYEKNKKIINNLSDSKNYIGKLYKSYKKAKKRNYNEAFSQFSENKSKTINNNDKKNVYNLNINNNNYFYINNNVYNVNAQEKNGYDFSKHKRFKEF